VTAHRDKFLIIKPARCTNFSNLFWKETLHVSDSCSAHREEFFTVHTAMVYVILKFHKWVKITSVYTCTMCTSNFYPFVKVQ
jgi:hypothetical protein